jgi:hypothetical protein
MLASASLAGAKDNFLRPVCHSLAHSAHNLPDRFHYLNMLAAEPGFGTPNPNVCYVKRISGQRGKGNRLANDGATARITRAINL